MRTGSEVALRNLVDSWNALLREHPEQEVKFAQEIYAVRDLLQQNATLLGALADSARPMEDRQCLAAEVFANSVSGAVQDLLSGVIAANWAEEKDFCVALDNLATQSVLAGAERVNLLESTEESLYKLLRLLSRERDLRITLADTHIELAARKKLAEQVFSDINPYGKELIFRALQLSEEESFTRVISRYMDIAAERGAHLVASVLSAVPLSSEQEERLCNILSRKYGADIRLHTTIDTSIGGGLRIRVGDEVIDGTLGARLAAVREKFAKNLK